MLKKLILFAALTVATPAWADTINTPFDIKGMTTHSTIADLKDFCDYTDLNKRTQITTCRVMFKDKPTLAGNLGQWEIQLDQTGMLKIDMRFTALKEGYVPLVDALKAKYGKPAVDAPEAGLYVWPFSDGSLMLKKGGYGQADIVTFTSHRYHDLQEAEAKAKVDF